MERFERSGRSIRDTHTESGEANTTQATVFDRPAPPFSAPVNTAGFHALFGLAGGLLLDTTSGGVMANPSDLVTYELCFPGGLAGETEVLCPQCDMLLTVPVDDPNGCEGYRCDECGAGFVVNWSDGQATKTN